MTSRCSSKSFFLTYYQDRFTLEEISTKLKEKIKFLHKFLIVKQKSDNPQLSDFKNVVFFTTNKRLDIKNPYYFLLSDNLSKEPLIPVLIKGPCSQTEKNLLKNQLQMTTNFNEDELNPS